MQRLHRDRGLTLQADTAALRRRQGKSHSKLANCSPVYGWFTEGFDTLDLKEAKTLLNELASRAREPRAYFGFDTSAQRTRPQLYIMVDWSGAAPSPTKT